MISKTRARLFIDQDMEDNEIISLDNAQSHYLSHVLRLEQKDFICGFDGKSGEYMFEIHQINKKNVILKKINKLRDFYLPSDLWLLFAPVKKDKTDFIIEKAGELGVRKIIPTITQRTQNERIKTDRYQAQIIESCEQCRRVDIAEVCPPLPLHDIVKSWDPKRTLYYMDETGNGGNIVDVFQRSCTPAAILVGPEGGFTPSEFELLKSLDFTQAVSMGKRILRAETAVTAALSCWQALAGDWK